MYYSLISGMPPMLLCASGKVLREQLRSRCCQQCDICTNLPFRITQHNLHPHGPSIFAHLYSFQTRRCISVSGELLLVHPAVEPLSPSGFETYTPCNPPNLKAGIVAKNVEIGPLPTVDQGPSTVEAEPSHALPCCQCRVSIRSRCTGAGAYAAHTHRYATKSCYQNSSE